MRRQPTYNYGMPVARKAWFEQVVRGDKTFTFDLARRDAPLEPVFAEKALVLLTAWGEFGFGPGGPNEGRDILPLSRRGPGSSLSDVGPRPDLA